MQPVYSVHNLYTTINLGKLSNKDMKQLVDLAFRCVKVNGSNHLWS